MDHAYPPRLEALTTLRFVAAAMIVAGHGAEVFGAALPTAAIYASAGAVSFFFVLSGFVLAWNYPSIDGAGDRKRFLWLRFARVWPLHLFCLGVFLACAPRASWVQPGIDPVVALALQATLLQAWVPIAGYFGAFIGVTWTLSVDVFFYALFPWLLAPVRRAPLATLAVALAVSVAGPLVAHAFGPARSDLPFDAVNLYALDRFFPTSRLIEFVLGMAAARVFATSRGTLPAGVAAATGLEALALASAIAALASLHLVPYAATHLGPALADWLTQVAAAPVLACLVAVIAHGRGAIARVLACQPAIRLGDLSFAVYLLHVPLLLFVPWRALTLAIGGAASASVFVAALLGAAYLAWRFVEGPARRAIVRAYDRRAGAAVPLTRLPTS